MNGYMSALRPIRPTANEQPFTKLLGINLIYLHGLHYLSPHNPSTLDLSFLEWSRRHSTARNQGHLTLFSLTRRIVHKKFQNYIKFVLILNFYLKFKTNFSFFFLFLFFYTDAQPTDGEKEIFDVVSGVLTNAIKVLEDLQQYQGAGDEIRFVRTEEGALWI